LTGRSGMREVVVRVAAWRAAEAGAPARLDLLGQTPERTYPVFIAGHGLQPQPGVEAGAVLGLVAGQRTGLQVRVLGALSQRVEGALSETFLRGVGCYMQRFTAAFPEFKAVEVRPASVYQAGSASTGRCASFFSGGVDSFFTLMKGKQRITDIIYIHGFDVRLDDLPRREAVDAMGQAVAQEMGIRYLPVESNMGKVLQDFGNWPQHTHGLALIAVARMMAGHVDEVRIPGSFSIAEQKPWGSWLETDHLFSDERVRIVHDACEARRMDKVRRLANEPLALKYLRVCWERVDGMYNCCRCEKCMRTMTSLELLGSLEQATAFALPLEPWRVARVCLPRPGFRIFAQQNLELLRESGRHWPEMERALRAQLERPIWVSRLRLKWRK